ncbi:MAG: ATP-binding cassette domain-containing protein [Candidatus Limnocylindrales bacterium]
MTTQDRGRVDAELEELDSVPRRAPKADDGLAIRCDNLVKIYKVAELEVVALQGLDLHVETADMIAIVGASGSGKSTLMNILGGLDVPSAGRAVVAGHDLTRMDGRARTRYRRRVVGFVWQQTERNLLGHLAATENVELPMLLDGVDGRERRQRATLLLDLVGLPANRRTALPTELSGGEQQRVAVAIALANRPPVLLADEPTGELDGPMAVQLLTALGRVNAELGTTIVVVTHDPLVSDHVQRTIAIRDGRTSTETVHRGQADGHPDRLLAVRGAGTAGRTSEEFAVLDQAGRLQLPAAHVEALDLRRRVTIRLADDHIEIWPDRATAPAVPTTAPPTSPPLSSAPPGAEPLAAPDAQPGSEQAPPPLAGERPPSPPRTPQRPDG